MAGNKKNDMPIADKILAVLEFVDSDETITSFNSACKLLNIKHNTFFSWFLWCDDKKVHDKYARAKDMLADRQAKAIVELTEAPYPVDDKGKIDPAAVQARRLEVDTKKWLLSKQAARKYGDRVAMEVSGEGGGPVKVMTINDFYGPAIAATTKHADDE